MSPFRQAINVLLKFALLIIIGSAVGSIIAKLIELNYAARMEKASMRVHCVAVTGKHYDSTVADNWFVVVDHYRSTDGQTFTPPNGATCARN